MWCTWSYLAIKGLQIALGIVILVLIFVWKSQGLNIVNLIALGIQKGFNYRNEVYCFISVSILSIIYAGVIAAVGFVGINLSPMVLTVAPTLGLILWLFSAPFMSATIDRLKVNYWARTHNLDVLYLEIATGMGFILMGIFVFDTFLGFVRLRSSIEAKRLSMEAVTPPPPAVSAAKAPEAVLPSSLLQTPIANQHVKGSMHEMGAVTMKSPSSQLNLGIYDPSLRKTSMHEMGHITHKPSPSENHLPTLLEAGESKGSDVGSQKGRGSTTGSSQGEKTASGGRLTFQMSPGLSGRGGAGNEGHDEIDAEVITMKVKPPLKGILKPHAETSV